MNIKEIKQLLALIKEYELAEFELEREGVRITVKKYSQSVPMVAQPVLQQPFIEAAKKGNSEEATAGISKKEADTGLKSILSPIVGTFYAAPSPESAAFVSPGTKVTPNDTVCIIEAMKVMNEIKAEMNGVIEEVLVQNGQAVEFGQILFKVRPF